MVGTYTLMVRYRDGGIGLISTRDKGRRDQWLETMREKGGPMELISDDGTIRADEGEILAFEIREE